MYTIYSIWGGGLEFSVLWSESQFVNEGKVIMRIYQFFPHFSVVTVFAITLFSYEVVFKLWYVYCSVLGLF